MKARTKRTPARETVHSFRTLLATVGTVARNAVRLPAHPELPPFHLGTTPDPLQHELLRLAGMEVATDRRQKDQA